MKSLKAPLIGIERHRLTTDGDGITTLVAFHGCPLRCAYCINSQCFKEKPIGSITIKALLNRLMPDNLYFLATGGGVTFGGGEPLLYSDFIALFAQQMPKKWNVTIETSLNVPIRNLMDIAHYVKLFVVDIKDMKTVIYKRYTGKDNSNVMSNLKWLADHGYSSKVLIRIPLIRGFNSTMDQAISKKNLEDMGFCHFDLFRYVIK